MRTEKELWDMVQKLMNRKNPNFIDDYKDLLKATSLYWVLKVTDHI